MSFGEEVVGICEQRKRFVSMVEFILDTTGVDAKFLRRSLIGADGRLFYLEQKRDEYRVIEYSIEPEGVFQEQIHIFVDQGGWGGYVVSGDEVLGISDQPLEEAMDAMALWIQGE